jgi:hypothetical protein
MLTEHACASMREDLSVRDVDGDERSEIVLLYRYTDLAGDRSGFNPEWTRHMMHVMRLDTTEQVQIATREFHTLGDGAYGDRNLVVEPTFRDETGDGRDDIVLDGSSWDADLCTGEEAPSPPADPDEDDECTVEPIRRVLRYDVEGDAWIEAE